MKEDYKEQIREANDIMEVIQEENVELKKSGKNWLGLCPFHEEKTPSFTVYPEKQNFKCFGCNESGDVFKFIELSKKITFPEALKYLANRAGISLPAKKILSKVEKKNQEGGLFFVIMSDLNKIEKKLQQEAEKRKWDKLTLEGYQAEAFRDFIADIKQLDVLHKDQVKKWLQKKWRISVSIFNQETKKTPFLKEDIKEFGIKTLIPDLIHLVREDDIVKYLVKSEGKLIIKPTYLERDNIYIPKQDLPIKIPNVDILTEPTNIKGNELLDEVVSFIERYLEMPSDSDYLLLALWIFHTYLIEKFNVTPLLYFYGVLETGKTRAGEVLEQLAFRGERLTSPTEATLFRSADYFKTTLIIDEIKLWGNDGNPEVARLIKSRYKRGLRVSRINLNKKGEDQVEYFDVFAPLAMCTTEGIPSDIESRCIIFLMKANSRIEVEAAFDEEISLKLRNRLTIFRANFFEKELPEFEQISRRRLNEIMQPLYQILMILNPERKKEFMVIIEEMQEEKEEEEGMSLEAEIIKQIKDNMVPEFLTLDLLNKLNEERGDKEKLSSMLVSIRTKRLGFKKIRMKNGKMGFKINPKLLKDLVLRFKIEDSEDYED
ncbi:DNA primase [subsurface metagenome]|jgi:hypothetical protein